MISRKYKCFFVHIPKTAGTSIEWVLDGQCTPEDNGHRYLIETYPEMRSKKVPCVEIQDKMDLALREGKRAQDMHLSALQYEKLYPEEFAEFFKFSFVRNPWDRVVSAFHAHMQGNHKTCDIETFEDYVANLRTCLPESTRWPMKSYVCDREGSIIVDFIGQYERLETDWKEVAKDIGLEVSLPLLNTTEHSPYWSYYTRKTRQIVEDFYSVDIEFFGYEFEGEV